MSFNERLPFSNQGTEFVRREVHAMEVSQAILSLDLVDTQFDFAEGLLLILVEVC